MYSNGSREDKKAATQLLEVFQKSPDAWEPIHVILNDATESVEYKLFAAQTLRSKVTYDLAQLPAASLVQLKDLLIEILKQYQGPSLKVVRTQLCIALSQLALQDLAWNDALNEIITKLSPSHIPCLLDFLKILPEELSDIKKTSLTDDEFNARTRDLITNQVEHVLSILDTLAKTELPDKEYVDALILDCLNSWIKECPIESLLNIASLTELIFKSLNNDKTFDKAIECLCTIMVETRDMDNYELIDALYQQLLQLFTFMKDKMSTDEDIYSGVTRLFVEAAEAWHVLIAKNPKHFKPLVEILLHCCEVGSNHDLDVVKFTFMFWYMLKQIITLPKFEESKAEFTDIYEKLIGVIIVHLTYPTDNDNDNDLFGGDKEQEDKFKEFRYEMGDVLKDCCAVVGPTRALNVPFQQIQQILTNPSKSSQWQSLEAPLFSMRAMAKEVPLKEKTILPVIMNYLVSLPEHPKIRYAATLVLGRYTEWTSRNPEFLQPQLNYIINGFSNENINNKEIIVAAAHALMFFCQDCSKLLVDYLEQLYMLYVQVKDQLDLESTYELSDGLAHVIKQLPTENLYKTIGMFCKPTLDKLSAAPEVDEKFIADQVEILTMFVSVLKCKDFDQTSYPICDYFIAEIWPIVSQLLSKRGKSLIISERILKLIKNAVQSFSTYLNPILPSIASLLHEGFKTTKFGCYLWVSGIVIREYGDEYTSEDIKESVYQFAVTQCSLFLELQASLQAANQVNSISDVVEDFFRMTNDLLMFYTFRLIGNFDLLKSTWESAILSLGSLEQKDSLIAVLHYLIDLLSWGLPNPPISFFEESPEQQQNQEHIRCFIQQFLALDNNGGHLMKSIIEGLIFKNFHNDIQFDANDLLIKILLVVPDKTIAVNWLNDVVRNLPNVDDKEVQKMMTTVSSALPSKDLRRIRNALKDFVHWYSRKNIKPRSDF